MRKAKARMTAPIGYANGGPLRKNMPDKTNGYERGGILARSEGGEVPMRAQGKIEGPDGKDAVPLWGERGEYVLPKAVVKAAGGAKALDKQVEAITGEKAGGKPVKRDNAVFQGAKGKMLGFEGGGRVDKIHPSIPERPDTKQRPVESAPIGSGMARKAFDLLAGRKSQLAEQEKQAMGYRAGGRVGGAKDRMVSGYANGGALGTTFDDVRKREVQTPVGGARVAGAPGVQKQVGADGAASYSAAPAQPAASKPPEQSLLSRVTGGLVKPAPTSMADRQAERSQAVEAARGTPEDRPVQGGAAGEYWKRAAPAMAMMIASGGAGALGATGSGLLRTAAGGAAASAVGGATGSGSEASRSREDQQTTQVTPAAPRGGSLSGGGPAVQNTSAQASGSVRPETGIEAAHRRIMSPDFNPNGTIPGLASRSNLQAEAGRQRARDVMTGGGTVTVMEGGDQAMDRFARANAIRQSTIDMLTGREAGAGDGSSRGGVIGSGAEADARARNDFFTRGRLELNLARTPSGQGRRAVAGRQAALDAMTRFDGQREEADIARSGQAVTERLGLARDATERRGQDLSAETSRQELADRALTSAMTRQATQLDIDQKSLIGGLQKRVLAGDGQARDQLAALQGQNDWEKRYMTVGGGVNEQGLQQPQSVFDRKTGSLVGAQPAGQGVNGAPYQDGTRLTKGGKTYVVRDGKPVLEGE